MVWCGTNVKRLTGGVFHLTACGATLQCCERGDCSFCFINQSTVFFAVRSYRSAAGRWMGGKGEQLLKSLPWKRRTASDITSVAKENSFRDHFCGKGQLEISLLWQLRTASEITSERNVQLCGWVENEDSFRYHF